MGQKVAVIVKDGQNVVSNNVVMEGSGAAGKPLIVKAGSKQRIELKDLDTHVAPDQLRVTKDGKNLKIKLGKKATVEDDAADIIIEGYFDNNASLVGVAENGEYYNFIPQGANYDSYYSLGGEVIGEETATDWMPLVLGLLGAGALAALASGGGSNHVDNTAPESLTIEVYDDSKDPDEVIVSTGGSNQMVLMASSASSNIPVTNDSTPTIKGVTEAGATVVIKDGAATLATVTADSNGNYTFTPTNPLNDGTHSITVTATDAAGNPITETTGYFIIDTTAPNSISMTVIDDVSPIIGEIINNGVTDDTTPTFNGTTEANATVTIKDGSTVLGTVTADDNGNYTFTPTEPLSEGTHSVNATATDAAGNTVTSTTTNFTVDTTAPTATADITSIATDTGIPGDFLTNDNTLIFSGTNTTLGANEKVQISLDGGKTWTDVVQADATHWSYDNSANAMTSGNHTIQARVIDEAGNAGTPDSQIVIIDTTAPASLSVNLTDDAAPIIGTITAGSVTNDTTPIISGVTEAGATVTAKDDAGNTLGSAIADSNGNYTITPTTPLSEGQHYISVTAADATSNSTTVSSGVFTVDTTAPTAPILDDTDGSIVAGTAEPGSTVTIKDGNGNPIGTTTANQNGDFSYTPSTPIADATVINATATDAAGNESQPGTTTVDAKITVAPNIYDDIAPAIGQVFSGDTTNDTQPEISGAAGSVTAGVTVTIYDNGTKIGETTSNADGSWSFTSATPFVDGSNHSITYTKNGGTNHSPAVDFTVDTTVPTITMALNDDVAPITGPITNGSTTNDTRPSISGVTEANATVTIKDGSTLLGTVVADGSGNYTFTPIAPLNEGAHSVNATATDAAGNYVNSTTTNFTVDSIAPTIEMTITDDVGATQGPISNGATIDDTKPTISGNTEAGATVTIKDGSTVLGTVTADADGNYSFTPDEPLSMNEHTITATATDAAGNATTSVPTTFTIAPPEVIDLGDHGQLINPVFVDGNYYYYWDKDKDGEGIVNGNPDQGDWFTHNELDAIFMYDVNGAMRPANLSDTNDTYRYAELEGYQVALPTYGGDKSNDGTQVGTNIDNVPPGEINPTYDDLVAIWDAFESKPDLPNGRTDENGTPPEWANGIYWSATPYETTQHYAMDFTNGHGGTNAETNQSWTAVQVIF